MKVKDMDMLREHIVREEGEKLEPYHCSEGFLTCCIGHRLDQPQSPEELEILGVSSQHEVKDIQSFTKEQSAALFENDVQEVIEDIELIFTEDEWNAFDATRQTVFISQCFQVGVFGIRKFKNMLSAMREGDWDRAAEESLDSLAARQTPARWERQAEMLRNGDEPKQKLLKDAPKEDAKYQPPSHTLSAFPVDTVELNETLKEMNETLKSINETLKAGKETEKKSKRLLGIL